MERVFVLENSNFSLYSLLIVSMLAVVVPLLVNRLHVIKIPIVAGEILVGVLFGKSGFNLIQQSVWLQFLQFFGLSYLMFVSGLEIDLKTLLPQPSKGAKRWQGWLTNPPVFALVTAVVTFLLAFLLSRRLYQLHLIHSPLMLALIITTTSLTVVVPVLKEYDILSHSLGQLLLAAAVLADFVTMLLISVAVSLYKGGFSPNILLVLVLILVLVVLYFVFNRFSGMTKLRNLAHGTAQLGIRASMALMIVFIVLSQTLGVQVIMGTFLAGVFVGFVNDRERTDIYHKLDAIGFGFLIPIFFIMVGVDFDIHSLLSDRKALLLLPVLLVATYLFKAAPALLLRLRYGWRHTFAGAALLTTQMSVTIAAAAVGMQIGAISSGVTTAIILVAMITSVISPMLFGKLLPANLATVAKKYVIVGDAPEAKLVAEQLKQRRENYDWLKLQGCGEAPPKLADISVFPNQTVALVVYSTSDVWNISMAQSAVKAGFKSIVCIVRDLETFSRFRDDASFSVVHPQFAVVTLIDQLMHFPTASQFLQPTENMHILEVHLTNHMLHQKRLRDVKLPSGLLIFSILRNGVTLVPHGDTTFEVGDTVVVVGQEEQVLQFHRFASARQALE